MRLGLYIFAALTLVAIIAAFTYTINPNNYIVDMMGINFNFPVALWVVLPALILFVFTVLHMLVYGLKNYFQLKKWQRDASTLDDAFYWSLVKEPKEQNYAVSEIRDSAAILGKSTLDVRDHVEGLNPRLSRVVNLIDKIKNGEYVDLKEEKMGKVFSEGNPLLIQNRLNRLEHDEKFVEEVMKSTESFSEPVRKRALEIFARKADFVKARPFAKVFDVPNFFVMLDRATEEQRLGLGKEILNEFVAVLPLTCRDFVRIADKTKKLFTPDENLALFKQYQKENPKAQHAYLYLLFEYELMDQVSAYLEEHEATDFMKFRALYDLKKENKKYKLEDLFDIDSVC
jgi:hypothetical protein